MWLYFQILICILFNYYPNINKNLKFVPLSILVTTFFLMIYDMCKCIWQTHTCIWETLITTVHTNNSWIYSLSVKAHYGNQVKSNFVCTAQNYNYTFSHSAFTNYTDMISSPLRPFNWVMKNLKKKTQTKKKQGK